MGIDKDKLIVQELENEIEVLRQRLEEYKAKINQLESENLGKDKVISDILNSKTFKFADRLGKLFRRKK